MGRGARELCRQRRGVGDAREGRGGFERVPRAPARSAGRVVVVVADATGARAEVGEVRDRSPLALRLDDGRGVDGDAVGVRDDGEEASAASDVVRARVGPRESARGHLRAIGATEKCAVEEEAGATPRFDDVVGEGGVDVGLVGGALGVRARGVGVVRQGDEPGVPAEIRGAHHAHAALHPDREKVVRGPRQRAGVPARGLPQRAFHRAQPGRHPARRKMRRGARGGSGSRC